MINSKERLLAALSSFLITLFLATLSIILLNSLINIEKQKEQLEFSNSSVDFGRSIEYILLDTVAILDGYVTAIESDIITKMEQSEVYLDNLIGTNFPMIRNVGIIEDTTIIWNYPLKGNEASIGVNLADIPAQRDKILSVKDNLSPVFQGPIDLVQGGQGFIARIPIINSNAYWGQMSSVINVNVFGDIINQFAEESNLNYKIFSNNNLNEPIYFNTTDHFQTTSQYIIEIFDAKWYIETTPQDGWIVTNDDFLIFYILILIGSVFLGLFTYSYILTKYRFRQTANVDYLTGLYNRNTLEHVVSGLINYSLKNDLKFGMYLLDINNFKSINDTHGHRFGDRVLIDFAHKLKHHDLSIQEVYRIGGDEFLLITKPQKDPAVFIKFKEKLKNTLTYKFHAFNQKIDVEASIGLAVFPNHGESIDELKHFADLEMYKEKRGKEH
jgi:diguanylate cyclase (GGDEF)-like protein